MRMTDSIGLAGLLVGGLLMLTTQGPLFAVGAFVLIVSFARYAMGGQRMRGSVGRSEKQLRAEMAQVEAQLKELGKNPDWEQVRDEWVRLDQKRMELHYALNAVKPANQ